MFFLTEFCILPFMELVAPAGNVEKLLYAWRYGADAAYIGLKNFSLRAHADNFFDNEYEEIKKIQLDYAADGIKKRLLCAVNITFHNEQLRALKKEAVYFDRYPFDAFIVQDIGAARVLKELFPDIVLHLSTQANCINAEAVRAYRDLGFKRVVIGREASLAEIAEIKQAVPEMEIECFVHGAMCIAYSGRCLMSAYMTGRSANEGDCAHSCRWNYKPLQKNNHGSLVLQESARPDDFFPVEQTDAYTALFSSKDLCMIDHLDKMRAAGVDAVKIEGRMKSIYYTALVTRAYRKKIDMLTGEISASDAAPFISELYNTPHRSFSTGFYFSKDDANKTTIGATHASYTLAGKIGKKINDGDYEFIAMNKVVSGTPLEYLGPETAAVSDTDYVFIHPETGEPREWVAHGHPCILRTSRRLAPQFLVRMKTSEKK